MSVLMMTQIYEESLSIAAELKKTVETLGITETPGPNESHLYRVLFRHFHSLKGLSHLGRFDFVTPTLEGLEDLVLDSYWSRESIEEKKIIFTEFLNNFSGFVEDQLPVENKKTWPLWQEKLNKVHDLLSAYYKSIDLAAPVELKARDYLPLILVVDDENCITEILQDCLASIFECHVLKAKNGQEALEIVKNMAVDFIITDYYMPEMNGGELIKRLRAGGPRDRDIPVILISGNMPILSGPEYEDEKILYIEKPVPFNQLCLYLLTQGRELLIKKKN